jgi:hypothetical protein
MFCLVSYGFLNFMNFNGFRNGMGVGGFKSGELGVCLRNLTEVCWYWGGRCGQAWGRVSILKRGGCFVYFV